jgi:hypothetical protein
MKGRIALDEEYMKCVRLARVSHMSRTCLAPVSLYRAKHVRNWCDTPATLVREIDKLSTNNLPVFYLLFLSRVRIKKKYSASIRVCSIKCVKANKRNSPSKALCLAE